MIRPAGHCYGHPAPDLPAELGLEIPANEGHIAVRWGHRDATLNGRFPAVNGDPRPYAFEAQLGPAGWVASFDMAGPAAPGLERVAPGARYCMVCRDFSAVSILERGHVTLERRR